MAYIVDISTNNQIRKIPIKREENLYKSTKLYLRKVEKNSFKTSKNWNIKDSL